MSDQHAPYSADDLAGGLRGLGLTGGDTVLIRAGLRALGDVQGKPVDVFIEALQRVLGPDGTIVSLAFTPTQRVGKRSKDVVFSTAMPSSVGSFPNALLQLPNAKRSSHPTNSFVAVGKNAEQMVANHGPDATCFAPIQPLMDLHGKLLIVGCGTTSPGFSTAHYAQQALGLDRKSLLRFVFGTYIQDGGQVQWWPKRDVPGCSRGFHKAYGEYVRANILHVGDVGDAPAQLVPAREAYEIELEMLRRDPRSLLCDFGDCASCHLLLYNLRGAASYTLQRVYQDVAGALRGASKG